MLLHRIGAHKGKGAAAAAALLELEDMVVDCAAFVTSVDIHAPHLKAAWLEHFHQAMNTSKQQFVTAAEQVCGMWGLGCGVGRGVRGGVGGGV